MASETIIWPKEEIPNQDILFMRIPKAHIDENGEPMVISFRNNGEGMSTNWNKYSDPEQTLSVARKPGAGVVQMIVGDVRNIPGQKVEHTPDLSSDNRAHTDVLGEKTTEIRVKFSRICKWAITSFGKAT